MTHFAIPGGDFSPAEVELASILDCETAGIDSCMPLGVLLFDGNERLIVVFVAVAALFTDGRWTQ
jgi:hypothetical protein